MFLDSTKSTERCH